jgi:hypothetical protein
LSVLLEASVDIHPIANKSLDLFARLYTTNEAPILEEHGYRLVGAWKRTGGPLNRIVHLYRFDDLQEYAKVRDRVRGDQRFADVIRQYLASPLHIEEVITLGTTPPWVDDAALARSASPGSPRQYLQAIVEIPLSGAATAHELLAKNVAAAEAAGGFELITAYEALAGHRGRLTVIGIFPHGVPSLAYQPGAPDPENVDEVRAVIPREEVYYLNPLPYSPLQ